MPRIRVTTAALTAAAVTVVDRDGFDALTLTAVADELGVAASTLYTHIEGLDGLKRLVAQVATRNLTELVRNSAIGASGPAALIAMGVVYRDFALDHPGQFASTLLPPQFESDELSDANAALLDVFVLVYRGAGLDDHESQLAARATRSAVHGFLAIEHITASRTEHDLEYRYLLAALQRGLLQDGASARQPVLQSLPPA
jgi:AcrR family transcriptional regulator